MGCEIQPAAFCLHTILRSQLDSPHAVSLFNCCRIFPHILQMRESVISAAFYWSGISKQGFFFFANKLIERAAVSEINI